MKDFSDVYEYLRDRGTSLPSNLSREEMCCVELFLSKMIGSQLTLGSIESLECGDTPETIFVYTVNCTARDVWYSHTPLHVIKGFEIIQSHRSGTTRSQTPPSYTLKGKVLHTHGSNDLWNAVITICESDVVQWKEGFLLILKNDRPPIALRPSTHLNQEFKDKMLCDIFEALTSERPEKR